MSDPEQTIEAAPAPQTGASLARAVAADFESFFLPDEPLTVRIDVESARNPGIKGSGDDARIVITTDMAAQEIEDADTLFFHLLILGHEIAHLVHRHLHAVEMTQEGDRALEYWADFYGAKVMMVLTGYGSRCAEIADPLLGGLSFEDRIAAIGRAVARMVEGGFYNEHPRYPKPLLRVSLVFNGVLSFLRLRGHKLSAGLLMTVFEAFYRTDAVHELVVLHPEHADPDAAPVRQAREWHRAMQGDAIAITRGFKLNLMHYLHTTFDQTEEEREASRQERLAEFQAAGFLLETNPEDLRGG